MTTATVATPRHQRAESATSVFEGIRIGRFGLGTVGFIAIVISAWGALVPFVGPLFGFGATGVGSWHWNLPHALVAVLPGAVGVVLGFAIVAEARGIEVGKGRLSLAGVGLLALACGAWFVVGPLAVPVLTHSGTYFSGATPLRNLANLVGYAMGPGLILALCGGFTIGWAARHQGRAGAAGDGSTTAQPTPAELNS
jgi:hypothetical protein